MYLSQYIHDAVPPGAKVTISIENRCVGVNILYSTHKATFQAGASYGMGPADRPEKLDAIFIRLIAEAVRKIEYSIGLSEGK